MTLIILLFALGVVLLAFEVIVPGIVLGTLGGLTMLGGCVMAFFQYGAVGGFIALIVAAALIVLTIYLEFRVLPRTRIGQNAFLTSQVTGVSAALGRDAHALIGKPAQALTMLSPSGYVRIDGQRYEAFCQSGQAPAGAALEVVGADNFRLIVTRIDNI